MEKMVLLVVLFSIILNGVMVDGKENLSSMERELLVEKKLKQLNKPAVKSFQTDDGGFIDCVDMYKQPAFDHPLLKNHTLQLRPSFDLLERKPTETPETNATLAFTQSWYLNESCPEGTVPIRRVLKEHLLNAPSIERFGMKYDDGGLHHPLGNGIKYHHSSATLITVDLMNGAKGNLNVWNPSVEKDDEYTTGQIWVIGGEFNESNRIEAGWTVNPSLYGDRKTRFFTYWTLDSGKTTGCYDLLCPGFVFMRSRVVPGVPIQPLSQRNGKQYYISIEIVKDIKLNAWWLIFGGNMVIGYWPEELFNKMKPGATKVQWGGDVYSPRLRDSAHTATAMGSGEYASKRWGVASFVQFPRIRDFVTNTYRVPTQLIPFAQEDSCYSAGLYPQKPEQTFYFGGPGRNQNCR